MPILMHPNLPGQYLNVSDARAHVLAKSGWVPPVDESPSTDPLIVQMIAASEPNLFRSSFDKANPTDAPDAPSVEDDTPDPALAGTTPKE